MNAPIQTLPELRDAASLKTQVDEKYDVVIIGSGAGGAVLAKELAEGGMRVALLEEGGYHHEHRDFASEAVNRLYRDKGVSGTIGRPMVPVPLGKCFGGTTTINSGTCFRTPDAVLSKWQREFGLDALEFAALAPHFDRVEREINVEETPFDLMVRSCVKVHELLAKQGMHGAPLKRNVRHCDGCGMCCYGCTSGAKQSMDRSYLPKALHAGAVAYTHARAKAILRDRAGRAVGVTAESVDAESRKLGGRLTLRAPIVIVACGTLISPGLLKENGIAKGNPHLGRHLTLHPASKVYGEFDEHIDQWAGVPQAYYFEGLKSEGIMFEGISMPPELGAMAAPFHGAPLAHFIRNYRHMASYGFMVSDTSEGSMIRVPGMGYQWRYSLSKTDVGRVHTAIVFLARLFLRGGAQAVYPFVSRRDNILRDEGDVDRFERAPLRADDLEMMAFHPLGTCRIAASPELGVCNPDHEVFGTPGLYVCDGSSVPSALGVNPQETIMMLATRLAEKLLGGTLT